MISVGSYPNTSLSEVYMVHSAVSGGAKILQNVVQSTADFFTVFSTLFRDFSSLHSAMIESAVQLIRFIFILLFKSVPRFLILYHRSLGQFSVFFYFFFLNVPSSILLKSPLEISGVKRCTRVSDVISELYCVLVRRRRRSENVFHERVFHENVLRTYFKNCAFWTLDIFFQIDNCFSRIFWLS